MGYTVLTEKHLSVYCGRGAMNAYLCTVCGYVYDQLSAERLHENQLISFQDLPEDWVCPTCGVTADLFDPIESDNTPDLPVE